MNTRELILLVDDDVINLRSAQTILAEQNYQIAATRSGAQALSFLAKRTPDLILLDINMPEMDGFETLEKIRAFNTSVPVVFLTADNTTDTEIRCFAVGALDFVSKPFVPEVLLSRVRRILDLERYQKHLQEMIAEGVAAVTKMQNNLIMGIATLIESRDTDTGVHVMRTQHYVSCLVRALQERGLYPDVLTAEYAKNVIQASVLHDVGKIKISDTILCKPGRLTDEEFTTMKLHAPYGGDIIDNIIGDIADPDYLSVATQIARHHHERWDGKGYPDGLSGEEIPLCARIMALADVTDALSEERCYKKPITPFSRVMDIIREGGGTQFDPVLTEIFVSMQDELERRDDAGDRS